MTPHTENGSSPVIGIVLLLGITFVLVMLLLLLCLGFRLPAGDSGVPAVFVIDQIRHVNPSGILDNDSYVVIQNAGTVPYDNRKLSAKAYRNGVHIPCDIPTMNGHLFLPTHHFGIQRLGGFGSEDFLWYPGATIYIDYAKGTFHPGDVVEFEVYDRTTGTIISRDTYPRSEEHDTQWFYNYFLSSSRRLNTPFFAFRILHSGQRQVSGTFSQGVPGGIPFLGSPLAGS